MNKKQRRRGRDSGEKGDIWEEVNEVRTTIDYGQVKILVDG